MFVIDFHRDSSKIKSHPAEWVYAHLRADQVRVGGPEIRAPTCGLVDFCCFAHTHVLRNMTKGI